MFAEHVTAGARKTVHHRCGCFSAEPMEEPVLYTHRASAELLTPLERERGSTCQRLLCGTKCSLSCGPEVLRHTVKQDSPQELQLQRATPSTPACHVCGGTWIAGSWGVQQDFAALLEPGERGRGGGGGIKAERVFRLVLPGVHTCLPFEGGILHVVMGWLVVHPLGWGREGEGRGEGGRGFQGAEFGHPAPPPLKSPP